MLGKNESWISKLLNDNECGFTITLEENLANLKVELNEENLSCDMNENLMNASNTLTLIPQYPTPLTVQQILEHDLPPLTPAIIPTSSSVLVDCMYFYLISALK